MFAPVHVFDVGGTGNLVVIGSTSGDRLDRAELMKRAVEWRENRAPWAEALGLEDLVEGLRDAR